MSLIASACTDASDHYRKHSLHTINLSICYALCNTESNHCNYKHYSCINVSTVYRHNTCEIPCRSKSQAFLNSPFTDRKCRREIKTCSNSKTMMWCVSVRIPHFSQPVRILLLLFYFYLFIKIFIYKFHIAFVTAAETAGLTNDGHVASRCFACLCYIWVTSEHR